MCVDVTAWTGDPLLCLTLSLFLSPSLCVCLLSAHRITAKRMKREERVINNTWLFSVMYISKGIEQNIQYDPV